MTRGRAAAAGLLALALARASARAEDRPLPAPPSGGQRVDYSAERVDYDADRAMLHLSTNVVVKESTWTVKGKDLWIDTDRRLGTTEQPILIENAAGAAYGDAGEFDFGRHTATLFGAASGTGDWRIQSREAELREDKSAVYRGSDFTSCNVVPPHYHFHATRVKIVPKSYLSAWNVLFFVGDIPVFYFPYFYKDLSSEHLLRWKVQPGVDRRNGEFLKTTLVTPLSDSWTSKIYVDGYTKQGVGVGGEINYRDKKDKESAGGLYGYNIDETSSRTDRWTLIGSDFQNLPSSSAFQGRLQLQSDPEFNNDYARSNLFRVAPELVNSAALVRRFDEVTARVVYSRDDIVTSTGTTGIGAYQRNTESLPRVEFQTVPTRLLDLPWLNTFSGFAANDFDMSRGYTQKSASGQWEATRSFHLWRGTTFTPKTDVSETGYDRYDRFIVNPTTVTARGVSVGRWTTAGDLRFNTKLGNIDAIGTYAERLRPDGFTQDTAANDRGVEQNDVQVSDTWMPRPSLWAKLSTGYSFSTYNDHALRPKDRVEPVVAAATWTPTPKTVAVLRDDYLPSQGNRAVIADFNYGASTGPALGAGYQYNLANPENHYASLSFAWAPSSATWRIVATLRTVVYTEGGFSRLHGFTLFEKDVVWTKAWHDFNTKLGYAVRPGGVGEVTASVSLRLGSSKPKTGQTHDWEEQFFPASAAEDDYRP